MKTCPACQHTYPDDFSLCPRDGARLAAQATPTQVQLAGGLSRRFRIVRRLGQGGMGTVFLAEQIGVGNRPVALKVLNRKLLDDPDFLLRFQDEAGSTGRIHHPNVVTIHESAQADDGTPYIAMEFLDGESLREALKRRGALPVAEVAGILQQAARGLNAAHKLGIIHRDLKPDNIFLTRGDEGELVVKLVDFGIAKLRESATHTMTGTVLGTPAYMSYEQASGMRSDELDARSDIYSLGVVTYEMLTGRVPFHSDTPIGYLRKHMLEEPPPFRAVAQGLAVPPAVESAVMKALVKDRDQRYGSALDFARELVSAARPSPRAEAPVAIAPAPTVPPPVRPQAPAAVPVQAIPKPEPQAAPHAGPRVGFVSTSRGAGKPRVALWVGVPLVALLLGLGGWYLSSAIHRGSGSPTRPSTESQTPSTNPQVGKPLVALGTSQTGTGQQGPVVEAPAPTSQSPTESEKDTADRRKQVEAAIRQGDNYYDNGEYDKAVDAYQGGLKLDPSNAQLLKALRRAQTAKAAEEKFNQ